MTRDRAVPAWPSVPPPPGDVLVAPDEAYSRWAASKLATWIREAAAAAGTGPVSVALAGGSTPRPVYASLAEAADVPWDRLDIFFSDERAVPRSDPGSNYGMARSALLDRVPIPAPRVHRMRAETDAPAVAACEYARVLPEALDFLLLGIGADGHTASLFPGADVLHSDASVAPALAPYPPHGRLTVTPRALGHARYLIVLASGEAKAAAVARALTGPWDPMACPAQLARRGTWLLDAAAASDLPAELCA